MVESLLSIINGIKSEEKLTLQQYEVINNQFRNIFFYLQSLMQVQDLKITPTMALHIIDLFSDIAQ